MRQRVALPISQIPSTLLLDYNENKRTTTPSNMDNTMMDLPQRTAYYGARVEGKAHIEALSMETTVQSGQNGTTYVAYTAPPSRAMVYSFVHASSSISLVLPMQKQKVGLVSATTNSEYMVDFLAINLASFDALFRYGGSTLALDSGSNSLRLKRIAPQPQRRTTLVLLPFRQRLVQRTDNRFSESRPNVCRKSNLPPIGGGEVKTTVESNQRILHFYNHHQADRRGAVLYRRMVRMSF